MTAGVWLLCHALLELEWLLDGHAHASVCAGTWLILQSRGDAACALKPLRNAAGPAFALKPRLQRALVLRAPDCF